MIEVFQTTEHQNAVLMLSNGSFWIGKSIGLKQEAEGEICFNVSMTGYQEVLTDPSYFGQIILFTFPHIGIVGCNKYDYESKKVYASGVIMREHPGMNTNYISEISLNKWLIKHKVTGISNVDTRDIAKTIRDEGAKAAIISCFDVGEKISLDKIHNKIKNKPTLLGQDLAIKISTKTSYSLKAKGNEHNVVVIDYGVKQSILDLLLKAGFNITVVPANTKFEDIMKLTPEGVVLSNGPGDPLATFELVGKTIRKLLESNIPILGICLGNQLIALACGLSTLKLHKGHRGSNHPVKNLKTGKVAITTQNHGFCVSKEVVPDSIEITHKSLFDDTIEGIKIKDSVFAVQYHPEGSPGPNDSRYLFQEFYKMISRK